MVGGCCSGGACGGEEAVDRTYRKVLWVALGINAVMFLVEIVAGLLGESMSLQADALDFLGDALNYGISLFVLGKVLGQRAKAAMIKGGTMGLFGLWVAGGTLYNSVRRTLPEAEVMGIVGFIALAANLSVAAMLFAYRKGDSNMRSVWICSRNDAIVNIAVILAGGGVYLTSTRWPDIAVAALVAVLSLSGAFQILRQAAREMRHVAAPAE
ncbi:MAG: cation transporter [Alphaproteobacteria bacterium]|nr:cation transporter [Alphaproteobacteria bacterium]